MTDIGDLWDQTAEQHAEASRQRNEQERLAVAQLLVARGEAHAAALVAMSAYRTDLVDNWNGGQYQVVLAVPPAQFDLVKDSIRDAIGNAAVAVVGEAHYAGLAIEVQLTDAPAGWDEALIGWLRDNRHPPDGGGPAEITTDAG